MGDILIRVKDARKRKLLLRLLDELDFVEVVPPLSEKRKPSKRADEIVAGIKEAMQEVELHRQGKIKLKTWQEMLDAL